MAVQLSQTDFQQLTRIIQRLPDFANVRDRRRLVAGALEGVPRADVMLARLDLDGTPMGVAVEVIRFLAGFGHVAYNKEALSVFLNYILPFTADKDAVYIAELFVHYPLDAPISPESPINYWNGTDSFSNVQEKIIGENTLRHIYVLELALDASKAVVHLRVSYQNGKQALGTGFMITDDLLMTNNHVIPSRAEVETTEFSFNYQLDQYGKLCEPQTAYPFIGGLFYTHSQLDYTVVQLKDVPFFGKPLTIRDKRVRRDDRVTIIQHPGGHLKKISIQNNFVAYADAQVVQYTTSTLPGSSGSPVFNDEFEVIAIHHSGGMLSEPTTGRHYLRNAGSTMIAVLEDMKAHAPDIYKRLEV